MQKGAIHIGTSGWHYKHWKEVFYPTNVGSEDQLNYYQQFFSTIEINNSFYKLPEISTFKGWSSAVPSDFIFAVKASRFFTHMKKLKVTKTEMQPFFRRVNYLKNNKGPVLFQLPPRWNLNPERLSDFLKILPKGNRYTFEFRNDTWYDDQVYDLLKAHNCAFCIYHLSGHLSPLVVTADFVYVRLHGPGGKYQGKYTTAALKTWAKRCNKWMSDGKDVFVYFDNDDQGYAVFNAKSLAGMLAS